MAEGRMIKNKASVSSDIADLRRAHGGDAVAFFLLGITHTDRYGCVPDDAGALRAAVIPRFEDITDKDVKRWCQWLVKRGMLRRVVGPRGDKGLQFTSFEHAQSHRPDREKPSPYEPTNLTEQWGDGSRQSRDRKSSFAGVSRTTPGPLREDSGRTPAERKGKEGKAKLSPSVPSGERGAGERGESGSAGRGQPASPVVVDEEEGRLAREEMARAFSRSERTRPFMSLMKGGQDG